MAALVAALGASGIGVAGGATTAHAASAAPNRAGAPAGRLGAGVMPVLTGGAGSARSAAASSTIPPDDAHLVYYGGRVISRIHVIQVLYGSRVAVPTYLPEVQNKTPSPSIASFYSGITDSTYIDSMSEYSTTGKPQGTSGTNQTIARGVFDTQVAITPSAANDPFRATNHTIDDSQIQAELDAQITKGSLTPPQTDGQTNIVTLYALYFPHGVSITLDGHTSGVTGGFCAYHGTTSSPEAYYSVLPDFTTDGMSTGCGNNPTEVQNVTAVSSHELAEAITDPEVGLASALSKPLAWYDPNPNPAHGENGDICNGIDATTTGGDGATYTVQKIWSNRQNACVVRPAPAPPAPFAPQGVGAPSVAIAPDGTQLIFWQGAGGHLFEAWWQGHWNGPVDWTAANGWPASMTSAPSVAIAPDGTQLIFWQGPGGHLYEAWWQGHWNGPVDWTAANHWPASVTSAPSVAFAPDGTQLIFWQGAGGHLDEVWWQNHWNGPVDWTAANHWPASVTSAPSVALAPDGTQLIFWQGAGGHLDEVWWQNHWNGPVDWTAANHWPASVTSAPSAALAPDGTQIIFWKGAGGHLDEVWWNGHWNGPVDWTAANHWPASVTSAPSVAFAPDGTQLIFWQGAGGHLDEVWWQNHWNGPVDWSA